MNGPLHFDGRKIPGEVMSYIRKMAVLAVEKGGFSPEAVINMLGLSRGCIYRWLRIYREEGLKGLETHTAPGAAPIITAEIEQWLRKTVLETVPADHGYDTRLWTRDILAELLYRRFGVKVSGRTVSRHLTKLGLSYQIPRYSASEQNATEVERYLNDKFPRIQKVADKMGAEIAFEDEAGINLSARHGGTWGERGKTPKVVATEQRGHLNIFSTVSNEGTLRYHVIDENINSEKFIEFLKQIVDGRTRPLILILDNVSYHKSKLVRNFVREHRKEIRIFFLPRYSPEYNPDEQVWNEIKVNRIGRQPVKNKFDLRKRTFFELASLQHRVERVFSFFLLPDTEYAAW